MGTRGRSARSRVRRLGTRRVGWLARAHAGARERLRVLSRAGGSEVGLGARLTRSVGEWPDLGDE
jgi:hypothetical protein